MYIILSRKRKNLGDTLILERFVSLLSKFKPDEPLEFLNGHSELSGQKDPDFINSAKAIILYGGPGYTPDMYPRVYPLVKDLDTIKTKIYFGGMGANVFPVSLSSIKNFQFTDDTLRLLNRVNNTTQVIGSRDFFTRNLLLSKGIKNVSLTGCPAWYDINSFNKEFARPQKLDSIVFTPPARSIYFLQARAILKNIKNHFPDSKIFVSFQRGLQPGEHTGKEELKNNQEFADFARNLSCEVVDTSLDTQKIEFYNECDIHVGYRVHGHIWFLSKRKPTFLIAEDSRGIGVLETLHTPGLAGFYKDDMLQYFISGRKIIHRISRKLLSKHIVKQDEIAGEIVQLIEDELACGFPRFAGTGKVIDTYFEKGMKQFLLSLP